jgi:uncharacterized protein (DUF1778 family)
MSTNKKRITVSLSPSQAQFVEKAADILGKPQSGVVVDMLDEMIPMLMPVIEELEKAKRGDISKTRFIANVMKVANKATHDAQNDLLDQFNDT